MEALKILILEVLENDVDLIKRAATSRLDYEFIFKSVRL